jgi:integrase
VVAITPAAITRYIESRQATVARAASKPGADAERIRNATINRELATLSRMLRLAYRNGKVLRLPPIDRLKEAPARQGFFERAEYDAVRRHLRADLQVAVALEHAFGWRTQSEVLVLERRQLDLEAGTLRLDAGTTKNDEGRVVYLTPELKALLAGQIERVRAVERKLERIIPWLFPHLQGPHQGKRILDFRKAWATACRRAGVAGRIRHDFRRTAVRNMVNLGVPERVAMKVTGHRTRAVFDRYHIVSPGDLQDVAKRLAGTFSGTSTVSRVDR